MENEELRVQVRRAARGDEVAAGAIFDHYYPRVFRYARARLASDADAEDVAAETFARVLKGLGKFRWKGAGFEGWLFRIASNLLVDAYRRAGRELPESTPAREEASEEPSPDSIVLFAEEAGSLHRLLDELPPDQREVLLLRFAADLDTHEVGEVMDRNPNAIRQLQFRALQKLREMMKEART